MNPGQPALSAEQLQHLADNFDTAALLTAVDRIDLVRSYLKTDGVAPPEIRDDLLELHSVAMDVINNGFVRQAPKLFALADDLSGQIFDMIEALQEAKDTLDKLASLIPDNDEE